MDIDYSMSDYNTGLPLTDEDERCLAGEMVEEKRVIAIDMLYINRPWGPI